MIHMAGLDFVGGGPLGKKVRGYLHKDNPCSYALLALMNVMEEDPLPRKPYSIS